MPDKDPSFTDMMQSFQKDVSTVKQTLGDLKAINDQINKPRSVVCIINNATDIPLSFGGSNLDHGVLATTPPPVIAPRTAAAFGAQSSSGSIMTGTEGTVWYNATDGTSFRFHWANPWVGSNESEAELTGKMGAVDLLLHTSRLYDTWTETGGGDEKAEIQFYAFQKMPTPVRNIWIRLGGATGTLGMPVTDLSRTPDEFGFFIHFERGSVYASPNSGVHEVHGPILEKWSALGWETSVLRYPTTDELPTPDGIGRFNHFENASIYWTPQTGAHEVHGRIRSKWEALGWEQGDLGYPVSDEIDTPDGKSRMNRFQKGRFGKSRIVMDKATGEIEVQKDLVQEEVSSTVHHIPDDPFAPKTSVGVTSSKRP